MKTNRKIRAKAYRHEEKFIISQSEMTLLINQLKFCMKFDRAGDHGRYTVKSLYCDDMNKKAYHEKEDGVSTREKYRFRYYDKQISNIKMEIKEKNGAFVHKDSLLVSEEELRKVIRSHGLRHISRENEVDVKTLERWKLQWNSHLIRPKMIIHYIRTAMIYEPLDVRITFDQSISYSDRVQDFLDDPPTYPLFKDGIVVLEVKYNEYLPSLIRSILSQYRHERLSVSKYALVIEKQDEQLRLIYEGDYLCY